MNADERQSLSDRNQPGIANRSAQPPQIPDYELLRLIGRGSYGEVWLARTVTGAFRAVKIVYRERFDHDRPFEREFSGIQKFEPISRSHENQVCIFHVGKNEQEGFFYYVMELADPLSIEPASGRIGEPAINQSSMSASEASARERSELVNRQSQIVNPESYTPRTLRNEILRRGRVPVAECLNIALSLTSALEVLHDAGLVHRDIKPSNIIFVNGAPKLADIGLVASNDATQSFVGTPGFLPPEGPGTPQADLFSLGKVLYEASTGHEANEFPELPTDLKKLPDRNELIEFNEVLVKACAPDHKNRYKSTLELRTDLEMLARGRSIRARNAFKRKRRFLVRFAASILFLSAASLLAWRGSKHNPEDSSIATTPKTSVHLAEMPSLPSESGPGLKLLWKLELSGVWSWNEAAVARTKSPVLPILFKPRDRALVMLTPRGEPFNQWYLHAPNGQSLSLDALFDIDGDGFDEAFVNWRSGKELFISIINQNGQEMRRFTTEGATTTDAAGETGISALRAHQIINLEHGQRGLLATIETGQLKPVKLLKPRGLLCFDLYDQRRLWDHPTGPYLTGVELIDLDGDGLDEIVAGSDATDNGNVAPDGTGDSHSYLYAFRADGTLVWTNTTGGKYSRSCPIVTDRSGVGAKELFVWARWNHELLKDSKAATLGPIWKVDSRGQTIRSYDAGIRLTDCKAADIDGDGKQEILAVDMHGFLHVLDLDLHLLKKIHAVTNRFDMVDLAIAAVSDLDRDGQPEIILTSSQVQFVSGRNPGDRDGEVNVRTYTDNSILILDGTGNQLAKYKLENDWRESHEFKIQICDMNGDGKPELLALADQGLVLEYVPPSLKSKPVARGPANARVRAGNFAEAAQNDSP